MSVKVRNPYVFSTSKGIIIKPVILLINSCQTSRKGVIDFVCFYQNTLQISKIQGGGDGGGGEKAKEKESCRRCRKKKITLISPYFLQCLIFLHLVIQQDEHWNSQASCVICIFFHHCVGGDDMSISPRKGHLANKFNIISTIYDFRISHQLNIRTVNCMFILNNYAVRLPPIA